MSIWAVHEDFLHTMHLGIYQWMFGSVLWLLTYILLPGTPLENSKRIMSGLRTYWRMHPTNSFNTIRPSMFERKNHKFPQLKGRASEIKHLAPGLLSVWETHCSQDPADEVYIVHQQIALMIKWFIRLDVILDQHPPQDFPKLPDPEAAEFSQKCFEVLSIIKYVNGYFAANPVQIPGSAVSKPLFNVTIKCHCLTHIAHMASFINPRLSICYSGEDFMRYIKQVVQKTVMGNTTVRCGLRVTEKIRMAMHAEFSKERWLAWRHLFCNKKSNSTQAQMSRAQMQRGPNVERSWLIIVMVQIVIVLVIVC